MAINTIISLSTRIGVLLMLILFFTNLNGNTQVKVAFKAKEVYKSDVLVITQISNNAFIHTSYLRTNDFGHVPCNGLVVANSSEAIVFDTPTNDTSAGKLIQWINRALHCKVIAIIPTHFHNDCLGGLKAFDQNQIPSYAYIKTIELARKNGVKVPGNSFQDSIILNVGREKVIVEYFGEGHTSDNVVGYFPGENIMFGGCLIKELNAGKGYLGDANLAEWSSTVSKVKAHYPNVSIVVPGHGKPGNKDLLDYTIKLFQVGSANK